MMQPKRTKFRKQFKGKISGSAMRGNSVAFGEFGLKATDRCRMTARELEAARRAISRHVKRGKMLLEIEGMSEEIAREAFRLASAKLSVSTAFVRRQVRS